MIDGASDSTLEEELRRMTEEANMEVLLKEGALKYSCPEYKPGWRDLFPDEEYSRFQADFHPEEFRPQKFWITSTAFDAIKHQLLALRLIKKTRDYWTLTPHGLTQMAELRAIRKGNKSP